MSVLTTEVVDNERFVKLYAASMPILEELSKSAFSVFKMLWMQVQSKPGLDRAELTHQWANRHNMDLSYRIVNRGIKELIEKEVIYKSTLQGAYYYNVKFLYNGNRMDAFNIMKRYQREGADPVQSALALEVDDA